MISKATSTKKTLGKAQWAMKRKNVLNIELRERVT